jgi:Fe-S-cluster-containing hydrogenase component 2
MIFEMTNCGGCRTCEIACSYRHSGLFKPSASSLRIIKNKKESGYLVELLESDGYGRYSCDGCMEYDEAFCLQVCHQKDKLKNIIEEYMRSTKLKS